MPSISNELREQIILRDNGRCYYCGKQGVIGHMPIRCETCGSEIGTEDKPSVWEVKDSPPFLLDAERSERWRNPNGLGWVIPFHIDHKQPRFLNGPTTLENLVLACRSCHCSKTGKEASFKRGRNIKGGILSIASRRLSEERIKKATVLPQ